MGVSIGVARVALNTSTGSQAITVDVGGLTPKAALFILTNGVSDGVIAAGEFFSFGAATGTANEWSVQLEAQDAQATVNVKRGTADFCVYKNNTGATTVEAACSFTSFGADTVTINIDTAPATAYLLTVVAFAGTDLTAYANYADLANTLDLETNITAPNFQPRLVIAACADSKSITAGGSFTDGSSIMSVGCAHYDGATVTQRGLFFRQTDNTVDVRVAAIVSTLYAIGSTTGSALAWGGEITNFDAQGFSVITRIAGANGSDIGYLALAFNGVVDAKIITDASATSTGNKTTSGLGLTPVFLMTGLSFVEAVDTNDNTDLGGPVGLAVMTSAAQFCNSGGDDDAAADSNSFNVSDNQAINLPDWAQSTGITATFTSFGSGQYVLNYTAVQAAAKQFWAVAIGAPVSGGLSIPVAMHQRRMQGMS